MNLFQSTSRALSISLDGLKEAVMNVAERVARRVQVAKLQFQADDAEARLRHARCASVPSRLSPPPTELRRCNRSRPFVRIRASTPARWTAARRAVKHPSTVRSTT